MIPVRSDSMASFYLAIYIILFYVFPNFLTMSNVQIAEFRHLKSTVKCERKTRNWTDTKVLKQAW